MKDSGTNFCLTTTFILEGYMKLRLLYLAPNSKHF